MIGNHCYFFKIVGQKFALFPKGKASHAKEDAARSKTTTQANTIIFQSKQQRGG